MIEKKHTLITGASGGIGAAIAETFATPDVLLSIHYHRNREQAEQVQKKCQRNGAEVILIQADLSQPDGPERLLAQLTGPVDVFVHAAGHSIRGLLTELTDQDLTELMMVHLFTPMKLARQLLPAMIQKKAGKIIAISSIWGVTGASYEVAYSAAKGGLNSFVKGLAKEVAPSGIQVNAIAPGAIETRMMHDYSQEDRQLIEDDIPAGTLGTPQDIANAVLFLAGPDSHYLNGQIIEVNGAWH